MSANDALSVLKGLPHVTACVPSLICAPVWTLKTAWMVGALKTATGHQWKEGTFGEASDAFFIDNLSPKTADQLTQKFNTLLGKDLFESVGPFQAGPFSFLRSEYKQVRIYDRNIGNRADLLNSLQERAL